MGTTPNAWQSAAEPHALLEFLQRSGQASDRKLRLFAVACARRLWPWIDALGQKAVATAERFADGFISPEELRSVRLACQNAGGQAAWYPAASNPLIAARNAARSAQTGVANNSLPGGEAAELLAQANLVREIFSPPSRPALFQPSWLIPKTIKLAQTIYDDRAFDRMVELAEVLVESGCTDDEILSHCRGAGEHVRGCWVVDLILGKH